MLQIIKSENQFNDLIKNGLWLVDFSATWCGPCRMLEPVLEEVGKNYNVLKIDVDELSTLATKYGVMSIPTLIVIENGQQKNTSIGYKTQDEIENMLKK